MAKPIVCLIALFCFIWGQKQAAFSYISIDTNDLNRITNTMNMPNAEGLTNIPTKTVPDLEYPNKYLSTGKIEVETPETAQRRFDLVLWIAMPAIFYLTTSIMYLKNQYVFNTINVDNTDNNYIYFSTFMIPIAAAYYDYLYMQDQYRAKDKFLSKNNSPEDLCMIIPLFYYEF